MAHEDYLGLRGFRTTICGAFSAIQRGEALSKGQAWKDRAAICLAIGAVVGVYGLVEGLGGWQASLGQVSFLRTAAAGNREQPILRPHLNPPPHSYLRATIGSTHMARHAGTNAA